MTCGIKTKFNKKKALLCIAALVISFLCLPSFVAGGQEEWRLYYTGTDGSKYFYDLHSIARRLKTPETKTKDRRIPRSDRRDVNARLMVKVTEKVVVNRPDDELKESKIIREFDCSARKVHTLMKSNFYKNGTMQVKGQTGMWKDEDIDSAPFLKTLYAIACPS